MFACDFAAGGDDNVIVKRVGNRLAGIMAWKDKDTARAAGKFILELRRMGYRENAGMTVVGDGTGVGNPMCALIAEAGIPIRCFNFGSSSKDPAYRDEGTRIWYSVAKMITSGKIVCPDRHDEPVKRLLAQLTSRRQKTHSSGKLWMESKDELRARGVKSPDIADAFIMAFAMQPLKAVPWVPYDDSARQQIARRHGWDYTSDDSDYDDESYKDRRNWNRPATSSDDGLIGFGGVNSEW